MTRLCFGVTTSDDLAQLVDVAMLMVGPVPLIAWLIVAVVVVFLMGR